MEWDVLQSALKSRQKEIIADVFGLYLIEAISGLGCDPDNKDRLFLDPISQREKKLLDIVKDIIYSGKANLNVIDNRGYTPLIAAIVNFQEDVACLLIDKNADPCVYLEKEQPPFVSAVLLNQINVVKWMLYKRRSTIYDDLNKKGIDVKSLTVSHKMWKILFDKLVPDNVWEKRFREELDQRLIYESFDSIADKKLETENVWLKVKGLSKEKFMDKLTSATADERADLLEKLYVIGHLGDKLLELSHNERMRLYITSHKDLQKEIKDYMSKFIQANCPQNTK